MGCNCKKKIDYLESLSDDKINDKDDKLGFFGNLFKIIFQIFFGIICGAIIIIVAIPFLIYVLISLIIGRNINLNMGWLFRKKKKIEKKLDNGDRE